VNARKRSLFKRKTGARVIIRSVRHGATIGTVAISPSRSVFVKCAFGRTEALPAISFALRGLLLFGLLALKVQIRSQP